MFIWTFFYIVFRRFSYTNEDLDFFVLILRCILQIFRFIKILYSARINVIRQRETGNLKQDEYQVPSELNLPKVKKPYDIPPDKFGSEISSGENHGSYGNKFIGIVTFIRQTLKKQQYNKKINGLKSLKISYYGLDKF